MSERRFIYGPLSVGVPIMGLAGEALISRFGRLSEANLINNIVLYGALTSFLLGVGFGIAGMLHNEKQRWLPVIGLGFNVVLIIFHFAA